ncbi:hypothetical protein PHMEG_00013131 [Phytophthora megakarya]|uniref:Reverse transcriptase n=1 Tax=Phytophthora megakarya TaxID=4795 RepID=A0A225W801_9STRA|nr:hypothetical protein PHMEG_00013131 [Phytophthora megakarya]
MPWVREIKAAGLIRRSMAPHGAPTFCVKKLNGWRIVHDYRPMNLNTIRRTMSMPRKDKTLEAIGYYQFRMREKDIPYTAFQNPDG